MHSENFFKNLFCLLFILFLMTGTIRSLFASTCYQDMEEFIENPSVDSKLVIKKMLKPEFGPVVHKIDENGVMDMSFSLYLPENFGTEVQMRNPNSSIPFVNRWIPMSYNPDKHLWSHQMSVKSGRSYYFRYKDVNGKWVEISDPNAFTYSKRPYQVKRTKKTLELFDNYPFTDYSLRAINIRSLKDFDLNFVINYPDILKVMDFDPNMARIEVKIFDGPKNVEWIPMAFDKENKKWSKQVVGIAPDSPYIFRISLDQGRSWQSFVDPKPVKTVEYDGRAALELPERYLVDQDLPVTPRLKDFPSEITLFDFKSLTPDINYTWKSAPPTLLDRPLVIGDIPLPAILPLYKEGKFAPRETYELIDKTLARRLIDSGVIPRLKEEGINSLQAVIQVNVADFAHPNWKFTYLVAGQGVDIQLGSFREVKELVDEMRLLDMELVPDIVVVHEVKNSSVIGKQKIKDAKNKQLFFHDEPYLFRDYSTFMQNLEDPNIRKQLIENTLRLVEELRLRALRLDFVDGLLAQYEGKTFFNPLVRKNFIEKVYGLENVGNLNLNHVNGFLEYFDVKKLNSQSGIDEFLQALFEFGDDSNIYISKDKIWDELSKIKDDFSENYGAVFVDELVAAIDEHCPNLVVISEAFSKAHTDQAKKLGTITYQPWVGYSSVDGQSIDNIVHALNNATGPDTRLGTGMAASHDNLEDGAKFLSGREVDGKHLGQLALEKSKVLIEEGKLNPEDLTDFITSEIARHELTALFGSDISYLTTLHHLRFKTMDDLDSFKLAFSTADLRNEIKQLEDLSGVKYEVIAAKVEHYMRFMRNMRKLYLDTTTIEAAFPRNLIPNIEISANRIGESGIAIFRNDRTNADNKLMIIMNRSMNPIKDAQAIIEDDIVWKLGDGSKWQKIDELIEGESTNKMTIINNIMNVNLEGLDIAVYKYVK